MSASADVCEQPTCCEVFTLNKVDLGDNVGLRVFVVAFLITFLLWCFMGVALISDVFMGAIEKITSRKVRKWDSKKNRYMTTVVWNPAVANLTLMALGSSAPEILLNVIGIMKDKFEVQPLGPSTIVGSAAFNLLCIIAVCVMAIPDGEVRYIKEYPTFICTAIFSLFAYVWLLIIIEFDGFVKNEIQVWEAVLTFLWFPVLITSAYLLDVGCFMEKEDETHPKHILAAEMTKEELAEIEAKVRRDHGADLTEEQVFKFVQIECGQPWSRAHYRVHATRALFKGKRVQVGAIQRTVSTISSLVGKKKVVPIDDEPPPPPPKEESMDGNVVIDFATYKYAVLESAGFIKLLLHRKGDASGYAKVDFCTRDGTAKDKTDYTAKSGTIEFKPGETTQYVTIEIVNDNSYEEDEEFYIDLSKPTCDKCAACLGHYATATVVIIDDDLPGVIKFPQDTLDVSEALEDHEVTIEVVREKGSSNDISCKYRTEDDSAMAGRDYDHVEGVLEFKDGETSAIIQVNIKGKGRYEQTETFRVILEGEVTGGAKLDPDADGAADGTCVLTVFIKSEKASQQRVDKLWGKLKANWEKAKIGHSNWGEQFKDAIFINGGDDEEDGDEEQGDPKITDWIMHIINVPWKLVFAFCPPTDYCGGWICFNCSLFFIGAVTLVIGDAAELLGCFMNVPDSITAITFVALGTSLPDTFASKTAALQDPHADASIVNVTGSNSVNVFLGIGLPWMVASVYHKAQGTKLIVESGDVTTSVLIFAVCACCCLTVLVLRRMFCGGELGGPRKPKVATAVFLVCLWFTYIATSSKFAIDAQNKRNSR